MKKRFLSFFLSLTLLAVSLGSVAAAADTQPPSLLVLGDSISEGYGLDGFESGSGNPTIGSYGNLVAAALGCTYGENYRNLSVSGDTSSDLLTVLSENGDLLQGQDVILMTVGGNDLIQAAAAADYLLFGEKGVISSLLSGEETTRTSVELSAMLSLLGSQLDTQMTRILGLFAANLRAAVATLRAASPDCRIIVQTIYEPFHCTAADSEAYLALQAVHRTIDPLIGQMNAAILALASELSFETVDAHGLFAAAGGSPLTNILSGDIHPNADGHALLAASILSLLQPSETPLPDGDVTSGEDGAEGGTAADDTDTVPSEDEEKTPSSDPSDPADGDDTNEKNGGVSHWWILLPVAVLAVLAVALILRRRKSEK